VAPPGEDEEEPTSPAKRPIAPKPAGVVQLGDRSWTVTRKLVTQWQDDPYALGNVRENGEGWELVGTRQRTAYHLGMRNGDILLEVNGHRLNSMVNLVAAYAACRNDTRFDVVFLRKGKRLTHHYEIKG
ncbi:MAG: S1C family serine protease, partial [Myxococcota bacterium]